MTDPSTKTGCSPTFRPLFSAERIAARVGELAEEIAAVYAGQELAVAPILSGSLVFAADLIRRLPLDAAIHVCGLSSYRGETTRPAEPRWTLPPPADLVGRHVLVIDDIVDSGQTLREVCRGIGELRPASMRTCALLAREPVRAAPDFIGFRIGPGFVVGYGLDFGGRFR